MTDVIKLMYTLGDGRGVEERASFVVGDDGGAFSRDYEALLVPDLRVSSSVLRAVSQGSSLFKELRNVRALHCLGRLARWERGEFTFCWGDLEVFETGRPVVRNAVLMQGVVEVPDLTRVMRYVEELKLIKKAV